VLLVANCVAQAQTLPTTRSEEKASTLRTFLQSYLRVLSVDDDKTTRYIDAYVDLNGDGVQEVIVYITGRGWCGSGGCITLILAPRGSSYRVVARILITRPPIRVLKRESNGWRNISVWVQGGGILPGYEAELRFNGKAYPLNPSVPPARRLTGKVVGGVVIAPSQDGMPLYQ
jgi:hypothetical protein